MVSFLGMALGASECTADDANKCIFHKKRRSCDCTCLHVSKLACKACSWACGTALASWAGSAITQNLYGHPQSCEGGRRQPGMYRKWQMQGGNYRQRPVSNPVWPAGHLQCGRATCHPPSPILPGPTACLLTACPWPPPLLPPASRPPSSSISMAKVSFVFLLVLWSS